MDARETALAELRQLAQHVSEPDPEDANMRFLERVAASEDPALLRDCLAWYGGRRLLADVRASDDLVRAVEAGLTELPALEEAQRLP